MNSIFSFFLIAIVAFSVPLLLMRYGKNFLIGLMPIYLITANCFAESFFSIYGTIQSLAVPIYCGTFLITDILSEYYGKKESQKAVWLGFAGQVFFVSMMLIITNSNILPDKLAIYQSTFKIIPRLILGSMVAYIVSQFMSVYFYNKIWDISGRTEKGLFWGNNISTILAQFLDTTILMFIAFYNIPPFETTEKLWGFILTTWVFKIIVAYIDFPFMFASKFINNAK